VRLRVSAGGTQERKEGEESQSERDAGPVDPLRPFGDTLTSLQPKKKKKKVRKRKPKPKTEKPRFLRSQSLVSEHGKCTLSTERRRSMVWAQRPRGCVTYDACPGISNSTMQRTPRSRAYSITAAMSACGHPHRHGCVVSMCYSRSCPQHRTPQTQVLPCTRSHVHAPRTPILPRVHGDVHMHSTAREHPRHCTGGKCTQQVGAPACGQTLGHTRTLPRTRGDAVGKECSWCMYLGVLFVTRVGAVPQLWVRL
jgi:hypothetical protein